MKIKKKIIKIATLTTVFAVGIGTVAFNNVTPTPVVAEQHLDNYDPYYYDGTYYDSLHMENLDDGMNGSLRTALTAKIKPAGFYTYGSTGETHLATQLQYADEDPENPNNMIYLYTRNSVKKNAASSWNREHVWCQSLSGTDNDHRNWGTTEGGTDILHLRPTYPDVNSTRNNHPYGETTNGTPKYYNNMLFGYLQGDTFEPLASVKGDVARIIMYLWVTYTGYTKSGGGTYYPLNILRVIDSYDTLIKWHTEDKPDVLEGNRNNYCQTSKQKNRNPFVDHPELAWRIFGDAPNLSSSVKQACMNAYPLNGGEQIDPTGIRLNKSTASVEAGKTLQLNATLEPSGATGTVTWSSNNTSVATVSGGLVTAKTTGTATITATVASYSASCTITVTEAVNNYGTLENPLTVDEALESIPSDGSETSEPLFVKGIVSSNSSFNTTYNNYSSVWLKSDDGSTSQALKLYRATGDSSVINSYKTTNSMTDKEIVVHGRGILYNGTTFELAESENDPINPVIHSISSPDATDIVLDRISAELSVGGTLTLHATLTPANSESIVTWQSSDTSVATVNNGGVVTAVSAGTAVITATVSGDIEAECLITVTGGQSVDIELASSISAGDTVYLACSATSNQYNGPSGSGTSAIGTYTPYTTTPDANTYPLDVCEGSETDTYAFKIKSGNYANKYLAWYDGNTLYASDTLNDNSSWTVSIDANGNATIANVDTPSRVIWWNVGSPRFCCYTGKSNGGSFKYVQLWKAVADPAPTVNDYFVNASKHFELLGNEGTHNEDATVNYVFKDQGLTNASDIDGLEINDIITLSGAKADNSSGNVPKYYDNSGNGEMRVYKGNTFTFESTTNITRIAFTFSSAQYSSNLTVNVGTLENGVWTGSATTITFKNSNEDNTQIRFRALNITYDKEVLDVSNVAMRFGMSMSKDDWNAINDEWGIDDYGVMLVKETTLEGYGVSSVKAAYLAGKTLKISRKGSYSEPYSMDEDNYLFTVKMNMTTVDSYNIVYRAAPFIVVDDEYYFLDDIRYSVNLMAVYFANHDGCNLSSDALTLLSTLH